MSFCEKNSFWLSTKISTIQIKSRQIKKPFVTPPVLGNILSHMLKAVTIS